MHAVKYTLKKINFSKRAWIDELLQVLWYIQTTSWTNIGKTPFSITYEAEVMNNIEVELPHLMIVL